MKTASSQCWGVIAISLLLNASGWAQLTWTKRTIPTVSTNATAAFGSATYVVGSFSEKNYTSANGTTWTVRPQNFSPNRIVFGRTLFIAVDRFDQRFEILSSTVGATWTKRYTGSNTDAGGVFYNGIADVTTDNVSFTAIQPGQKFGTVSDGYTRLIQSSNGTSWTTGAGFTLPVLVGGGGSPAGRAIALGNGTYVLAAEDSAGNSGLYSSTNGTSWALRHNVGQKQISRVFFANNLFVAVGENGTILTSSNGSAWTTRASSTIGRLNDVAFGASKFVVVGVGGTIRVSTNNGVNWTSSTSGTFEDIYAVTFGGTTFLAAGDGGLILQSN